MCEIKYFLNIFHLDYNMIIDQILLTFWIFFLELHIIIACLAGFKLSC